MFTKEHLKSFVVAVAAVMVGLAAHQVFVAPKLAPKAKA